MWTTSGLEALQNRGLALLPGFAARRSTVYWSADDQVIELSSAHAIKRGAPRLRRVGYRDTETNRHYQFLTNNLTLSATTIAAIYKDRWKVELFFKAIKQNLKIKTFVGTSRNAVMTQIWIAKRAGRYSGCCGCYS